MIWDTLHRWWMPFAALTTASLISVPAAMYFQNGMTPHAGADLGFAYGDGWVLRDDVLATIVPYALNLVTIVWLFNADGSTRWAAFWASILALTKIIIPVTLTNLSDASVLGAASYVDWHTLRWVIWFTDIQMVAFGLMVWITFARFVGNGSHAHAHGGHYAEA